MDMGSLTIFLLMFCKELLTGSTEYIPIPCTLEGDFSFMECPIARFTDPKDSENPENIVNWFRKDEKHGLMRMSPETNSRIVVNGDILEFWPAEVSDTGDYLCVRGHSADYITSADLSFTVIKINKDYCFNMLCACNIQEKRGIAARISCGDADTFTEIISIVWYKGCDFYAENTLALSFDVLKDDDAGNYSCVVKRTHEGNEYSYTKTYQLDLQDYVDDVKPHILGDDFTIYETITIDYVEDVKPHILWDDFTIYETITIDYVEDVKPHILGDDFTIYETITIGKPKILNCTAFTGHSKQNKNSLLFYWIKVKVGENPDGESADFLHPCTKEDSEMPCVNYENSTFTDGNNYKKKAIIFHNVKEEDLEYNYICKLDSTIESQNKTFILKKKEQNQDIAQHTFTTGMIVATVFPVLFVTLAFMILIFRIETTLLFRRLTRKDETTSDGREYDAYVSFLKYSKLDTEDERHFALDILSYTLEKHFGYKLCIFERDVLPGGAIVDEINSFIDKSRRLIVILSKNYVSDNAMYELESGLYKSLVERKIKVILIEYNLQGDIQLMPESLDLLKSSSKVRWKEDKSRPLNSRFWKKMQYLMPAKPVQPSSSAFSDTMFVSNNITHSAYY